MDNSYIRIPAESPRLEIVPEHIPKNPRSRVKSLQRNPSFSYKYHDMFNIPNSLLPPAESPVNNYEAIFIKPKLTRITRRNHETSRLRCEIPITSTKLPKVFNMKYNRSTTPKPYHDESSIDYDPSPTPTFIKNETNELLPKLMHKLKARIEVLKPTLVLRHDLSDSNIRPAYTNNYTNSCINRSLLSSKREGSMSVRNMSERNLSKSPVLARVHSNRRFQAHTRSDKPRLIL